MKLWPLLALLVIAGCRSRPAPASLNEMEAVEKAEAAAQAAFAKLSGELARAMGEGGPPAAIQICSTRAAALADEIGREHGVSLKRVSDRPRNPAQMATTVDKRVMETFQESILQGSTPAPQVVRDADGSAEVRLPIMITSELCLSCHGGEPQVLPETRTTLAELYPQDKATGYALNELRGIWKVTVPAP